MGTAIFVMMVVQSVIGFAAHYTRGNERQAPGSAHVKRFDSLRNKNPVRPFHAVVWLVIIGLGYAQIWSGFDLWQFEISDRSEVPQAVKIVYGVLMGVFVGLWALGWVLEALKVRLGRSSQRPVDYEEKPFTATRTDSA